MKEKEKVMQKKPDYVLPAEAQALADQMEIELDQIRNAALPPDHALPPLTEKQHSRLDAFTLREDR